MTQELIHFFIAHWMLSSAFVVLLLLMGWYELKGKAGGLAHVSPQQLVSLINREAAVVVDLRSAEAFKAGRIIGAKNIDPKKGELKNKEQSVIIVCEYGQQSIAFGQRLRSEGHQNVQVLQGGMQAWQSQSLPMVKK